MGTPSRATDGHLASFLRTVGCGHASHRAGSGPTALEELFSEQSPLDFSKETQETQKGPALEGPLGMGLVTLREPEISLRHFKASKSPDYPTRREAQRADTASGAEVRDTQRGSTEKIGGQRRREGRWQPGSLGQHGGRMQGQTQGEAPGFKSPGSQ